MLHRQLVTKIRMLWKLKPVQARLGLAKAKFEITTKTETHYECQCGFNVYLDKNCPCELCQQFNLIKPLEACPNCGEVFVQK